MTALEGERIPPACNNRGDEVAQSPSIFLNTSTATPGTGGRADARIDTLLSRLLDLSLWNRLLSFKLTKQSMCIATGVVAGIGAVENAFSRTGAPWLRMAATAFPDDIAAQGESTTADLSRGILRRRTTDARCATESIAIFRRAQRTLDETGANPLFLVIGTLEHRDPESGQSARVCDIRDSNTSPVCARGSHPRRSFLKLVLSDSANPSTSMMVEERGQRLR